MVVVGGGQAGLATGFYLRRSGLVPGRDFELSLGLDARTLHIDVSDTCAERPPVGATDCRPTTCRSGS